MAKSISKRSENLTVVTRGRFKVLFGDKTDLTPKNRKERGLIALLALSADHRRSRLWLQAMLWSTSPPDKAAGSLRTALKNLRRQFGSVQGIIESDRHEVWLSEFVRIKNDVQGHPTADLLELVDAPDPAFDEWLRDIRTLDEKVAIPDPVQYQTERNFSKPEFGDTVVAIGSRTIQNTAQGAYLEAVLVDAISTRFEMEGADRIYTDSAPDPDEIHRAGTVIHLEVISVLEAGHWSVRLRALADSDRRFLWAGRMSMPADSEPSIRSEKIAAFVSQAMTQVLFRYHAFRNARSSTMMILSRAVTRLYDPDIEIVTAAQKSLFGLEKGEAVAVSLAWQGFAKLVRYLEFCESVEKEEAEALVGEARHLRPGNPLVTALAARVAMDVTGDLDRADHLAKRALGDADSNPYVLQAAARIDLKRGRLDTAHELATRARRSAEGYPHAFAWDFELCLTALARHELVAAQDAARRAHRCNNRHRATLRYLVATSLMMDDVFEAEHSARRLSLLEDGFQIDRLFDNDYPIHTLRNLGLVSEMRRY